MSEELEYYLVKFCGFTNTNCNVAYFEHNHNSHNKAQLKSVPAVLYVRDHGLRQALNFLRPGNMVQIKFGYDPVTAKETLLDVK
jgi:hypothetical protein